MSGQNFRSRLVTFLIFMGLGFLLLVLVLAGSWGVFSSSPTPWNAGLASTYVDGPRRSDGSIDYRAALNLESTEGVDLDKNAALWYLDVWDMHGADSLFVEELEFQLKWDRERFPRKLVSPETRDLWLEDQMDPRFGPLAPDFEPIAPAEFGEQVGWLLQGQVLEADFSKIRTWLSGQQTSLDHLVVGSQQPGCFVPLADPRNDAPLVSILLGPTQAMRFNARVLIARGNIRLLDGDIAGARADAMAVHRMAYHTVQQPLVICLLVGYAMDHMAFDLDQRIFADPATTSDDVAAQLTDLAALSEFPSVPRRLAHAERMVALDAAMQLARGKDNLPEFDRGLVLPMRKAVDWGRVMRRLNSRYDQLAIALEIEDFSERSQALKAIDTQMDATLSDLPMRAAKAIFLPGARSDLAGDVLMAMFMPAGEAVMQAEQRHKTALTLTQLSGALTIFHAQHDQYPDGLSELAPGQLAAVPVDPFADDGLFRYRSADGTFRLYSVGQNRVDDGGGGEAHEIDDIIAASTNWKKVAPPTEIHRGSAELEGMGTGIGTGIGHSEELLDGTGGALEVELPQGDELPQGAALDASGDAGTQAPLPAEPGPVTADIP